MLLFVYKQPGANVVETINGVKEALPQITAALPGGIDIKLTGDRSATIRASLAATEETLLVAVGLVILVVFALPALRARHADPGGGGADLDHRHLLGDVPARLLAQHPVADGADHRHRLRGRRRHRGAGERPAPHRGWASPGIEAALIGAREVGFTVISMSLSLIAVFLPILLMGGLVGRIFQEFSVTLSLSILISLVLSLTTTPMMCARLAAGRGARPTAPARAPAEPPDPRSWRAASPGCSTPTRGPSRSRWPIRASCC